MLVAMRLEVRTREKRVRRLIIRPRPIFPLTAETKIHKKASITKKVICENM
jgi:hypothetical protein